MDINTLYNYIKTCIYNFFFFNIYTNTLKKKKNIS